MDGPYKLINKIYAHDGPIRSICIGIHKNEIITGCQSDSPNIKKWVTDNNEHNNYQENSIIYHDHWVTAVASLVPNNNRSYYKDGCTVTGCMDSKIRIYDNNNILVNTLQGHSKGIISLSWTSTDINNNTFLLSGSWDGSVCVWDLKTSSLIRQIGSHENGVHVIGLNNNLIATVSTGESVNGKPANFKLRIFDYTTGELVSNPIEDHTGSIRSITSIPMIDGFITTGNDGMVVLRSANGQAIDNMFHKPQEDGSPPFILDCCVLHTDSGMDYVTCGEDGSVMIWNGNQLLQSIPHPTTVWTMLALPNGNFITAGHDGVMRIFSNNNNNTEQSLQYQLEFITEVNDSIEKKRTGPSSEEIAKAPKWEHRSNTPGTSENQVMVFNKEGKMIAAQWMAGSWVLIGEVTGSGDGGYVNNQWFDHVMPVEIETPNGLQSLKLGVNNAENPFVAAQRFINENNLDQNYLSQIADWIVARSGQQAPTLGAPTATTATTAPPSVGNTVTTTVSQFSQPITSFLIYDEVPKTDKLISKLSELNNNEINNKLTAEQLKMVTTVLETLHNTAYYHASEIDYKTVSIIVHAALHWDINNCFPLFDILRVIALHPSGAEQLSKQPQLRLLIERLLSIINPTATTGTIPMPAVLTAMRLCCNIFKIDSLRLVIWQDELLLHIINTITTTNNNKLIRIAASRTANNITIFSNTYGQYSYINLGLHIVEELLGYCFVTIVSETESIEIVYNILKILGTLGNNFPLSKVREILYNCQLKHGKNMFDCIGVNWINNGKLTQQVLNCYNEIKMLLN